MQLSTTVTEEERERSPDEKNMSFATIGEMASRRKNRASDEVHMMGPPPTYAVDEEDTLAPRWYEVKHWSKKVWLLVGLGIAIIIAIIIVIAVVVSRNNRYPNYSKLNYSLKETCAYFRSLPPLGFSY